MTPEIKQRIDQVCRGEVPEGYQRTILGIEPRSWNKSRIDKICRLSSGSTPRRDAVENFNGDILWVTSGELKRRTIWDTREKISETAVVNSHLEIYDPGTVVIAIYGLEAAGIRGTVSIIGKQCTISQACMAFTEFKGVDNEFFYYWYLNNGQVIGLRYAQGTKQQNLSTDIVGSFPICFPSQGEQQRIAAILTTQDKVIELKEKRLAEKQRQKKYLMQQLLTGKKRLPGFSGQWEIKGFNQVFTFGATNTFSRECMCEDSTGVKNIHYGDILVRYGEVLKLSEQEIPSLLSDIGAKITTFVDDGDVVIADTAEDLTAGKVVEVQETHGKKVAAGLHTMLCKPIKGCFAPGWLGYYMNSETYHKQLVPYIAGVKVMSISKGNIVKTHILVPPIEEQTAIVKVFSTTDHEIDLLRQNIEQEKQKKKALMQLLLTGIVRVCG